MPRRSILSAAERENLLALPGAQDELIRYYTFSEENRGRPLHFTSGNRRAFKWPG